MDRVVTFRRHHDIYQPGDTAAFAEDVAQSLVSAGVAGWVGEPVDMTARDPVVDDGTMALGTTDGLQLPPADDTMKSSAGTGVEMTEVYPNADGTVTFQGSDARDPVVDVRDPTSEPPDASDVTDS